MVDVSHLSRHDSIAYGLQTAFAPGLGRQIVDAYHLDSYHPSIAVFDTPALDPPMGGDSLHPDLLAVINTGCGIHLTAIIEVKRMLSDLMLGNAQYASYIGYTSCFFIAVPTTLLGPCITRIQSPLSLRCYKGIINADNGDIVVLPRMQQHSVERETRFLSRTFADARFRVESSGLYRLKDVPPAVSDMRFTSMDWMQVRAKYADVVREEMKKGFPARQYYKAVETEKNYYH